MRGGWVLTLMVLVLIPAVVDAQTLPPGGTFLDDDGNFHEPAIETIAAAGITAGCNPAGDLYCPRGSVTRAEMAVFLVRALARGREPPALSGDLHRRA
jgi:hypothetical protein